MHWFPDPPEVSIELGSKLNAVDIREGDDVYFECTIDAFPLAERISWKKDVSNMTLLSICSPPYISTYFPIQLIHASINMIGLLLDRLTSPFFQIKSEWVSELELFRKWLAELFS